MRTRSSSDLVNYFRFFMKVRPQKTPSYQKEISVAWCLFQKSKKIMKMIVFLSRKRINKRKTENSFQKKKKGVKEMGLRESAWKFDGCSSGGLSFGVVAATKGELEFIDPSGRKVIFSYIAAGLGVGVGLKSVSKVLPDVSGSVAPSSYWSTGKLYILPGVTKNELTSDDLQGMCEFVDVGGSLGGGISGTILQLGGSNGIHKATLFVASQNTGLGAGAYYYIGSLTLSKSGLIDPIGLWEVRANGEIFYYRFKSPNTVQWSSDRNMLNIKGEGSWQMKSHTLRIDWNSGDYEDWDLPLFSSGQSGIWFTKGSRAVETMAFQGVQGLSHKLSARQLGNTYRSNALCKDEAMATCD